MDRLRAKLRAAGWVLNTKKSEVNLVRQLIFLGAKWDPLCITRDKKTTTFVRDLASSLLSTDPKGRQLQRIRG